MKKELDKTVLFLGLLTIITGLWISALTNLTFSVLNQNLILVVLAVAFANCSTNALKIVGYSLSAILGTFSVKTFIMLDYSDIGTVVVSVGHIIMSLAAVIYLVKFLLGYFGFVKMNSGNTKSEVPSLLNELARYKEMQEDGILTADEFSDLKQSAMNNTEIELSSIEDLKKWKKLLDQQVITNEEFAIIKKNIFVK